jgi:hypothetical protein
MSFEEKFNQFLPELTGALTIPNNIQKERLETIYYNMMQFKLEQYHIKKLMALLLYMLALKLLFGFLF